MRVNGPAEPKLRRFDALLADGACPRPLYDQILLEEGGCVVAPTLGSIVPNWLLVVPRTPALSMVHLRDLVGIEPEKVVDRILARLQIAEGRTIWFEHGPRSFGSKVGCGIDQAHIHILIDAPFGFSQFATAARESGRFGWRNCETRNAYAHLCEGSSYLLAASAGEAIVAQEVDDAGSQFFRRMVAGLTGKRDEWDYRLFPHMDNVERTIRAFAER